MSVADDGDPFRALDPFFAIVQRGLEGLADGAHFWDLVSPDAVFEFLYDVPGWPRRLEGRDAIMAAFSRYGDNISLTGADSLVVHRGIDPRIVVLEYEVHGAALATGRPYDNRFASIITIEGQKIVRWRDYMDSLSAMRALAPPGPA